MSADAWFWYALTVVGCSIYGYLFGRCHEARLRDKSRKT